MSIWLIGLGIAAGVAGVLSGLGVGSAGVFVLYLTLVVNYGQREAQALNLLFFFFSAGAAMLLHVRRRRIPWRTVGALVLAALPGALCGVLLARTLDAGIIRRLFGGMLAITGALSLRSSGEKRGNAKG